MKISTLIKKYPHRKLALAGFLLFPFSLYTACNLSKLQLERQAIFKEKKIVILEDSSYNLLQHPKLYAFSGDTFLTGIVHHQEIVFWNLSTLKKEKVIDLKLAERQNIFNFYIENENRILVALNPIFRENGHESSILYLDSSKNILDSFSFGNLPVFRTYNESLKSKLYHFSHLPLYYDSSTDILLVEFMPYGCNFDSVIYPHPVSQLAKISYRTKNDSSSFIFLPDDLHKISKKNCEFPGRYHSLSGIMDEKSHSMIIGSPLSQKIFRYNYFENSWKHCGNFGSYLTEGEIKTTEHWKANKDFDDIYSPYLSQFVYNESTQLYYRLTRVPKNDTMISMENNYPFCTLSVYDKTFVKLGESPLEFRASDYFIVPYQNGVLLRDQLESDRKHKIVLRHIEYSGGVSRKSGWLSSTLDSLRIQESKIIVPNIITYLSQITATDSSVSGSFLLIPLQNSCPACIKELATYLNSIAGITSNSGRQSGIKLILLSTDQYLIDQFVFRLDEKAKASFNIQIDKSLRYLQHTQKWVNLRLVVADNNLITSDTIYDPGDLEALFEIIRKSIR